MTSKEGQKLMLAHETNPEVWKDALAGAGEKRAFWEVDKIMFGSGKYIDDEVDLTPLYGLYIEGSVK